MAARYASTSDAVAGLALLAAYPEDSVDLSGTKIAVVVVTATEDEVATRVEIDAGLERLPPATAVISIEGGNHAQFGWYGDQPGDGVASITRESQTEQAADAIIGLMERLDE
jgi:hypothetical protein